MAKRDRDDKHGTRYIEHVFCTSHAVLRFLEKTKNSRLCRQDKSYEKEDAAEGIQIHSRKALAISAKAFLVSKKKEKKIEKNYRIRFSAAKKA